MLQKPDSPPLDGVRHSGGLHSSLHSTALQRQLLMLRYALILSFSSRPTLFRSDLRPILTATAIDWTEPDPITSPGRGILMATQALAFDFPNMTIRRPNRSTQTPTEPLRG